MSNSSAPETLAGIVLVDGGVGEFEEGESEAISDFGMLQGVLQTANSKRTRSSARFASNARSPKTYLRRVIAASKEVPTNTAVALLVGYFAADYRKTLPKMDKPTLVIAAKSIDPSGLANMAADIPNSRIEVFDNVGHALFVDDPEKFNSVVGSFILHAVIQGKPLQEP